MILRLRTIFYHGRKAYLHRDRENGAHCRDKAKITKVAWPQYPCPKDAEVNASRAPNIVPIPTYEVPKINFRASVPIFSLKTSSYGALSKRKPSSLSGITG